MAFWRSKTPTEEHADQHRNDPVDGNALGARERIVRAAARGVADAVLDRMTPAVVERVKRWWK